LELRLESASERYLGFAGLVRSRPIFIRSHAAIGIFFQREPASKCGVGFAGLVRARPTLICEYT
jgi:hypothetical protein